MIIGTIEYFASLILSEGQTNFDYNSILGAKFLYERAEES